MESRLHHLQQKLESMPPVASLQLRVEHWRDGRLTLVAPLAPNVNDKGCAFGGSLASLMTLSAWGLSTLELAHAGFEDAEVYVQDSHLHYVAPLFDDLRAEAWLSDGQKWASFIGAYRDRGKARATLRSRVLRDDGSVAAHFEGRFVALRPKSV